MLNASLSLFLYLPGEKKSIFHAKYNLFRQLWPWFVPELSVVLNEIVCGLKHTNHSHLIAPTFDENNTAIMCPSTKTCNVWPQVGAVH